MQEGKKMKQFVMRDKELEIDYKFRDAAALLPASTLKKLSIDYCKGLKYEDKDDILLRSVGYEIDTEEKFNCLLSKSVYPYEAVRDVDEDFGFKRFREVHDFYLKLDVTHLMRCTSIYEKDVKEKYELIIIFQHHHCHLIADLR